MHHFNYNFLSLLIPGSTQNTSIVFLSLERHQHLMQLQQFWVR